jgi:hypothetical protein
MSFSILFFKTKLIGGPSLGCHWSNDRCYNRRFIIFNLQNVCDIPQDLDQKSSDICNDSTPSPLKINHFTSVSHFDQSHAASASSMTKHNTAED